MADKPVDRAKVIASRKTASLNWLESNYYPQWEEVFQHYKAEREPEKTPDGKIDLDQSSIGTPLTWGFARRTVARGTAQPPNLRFHAKDQTISELISRTLMYQWDKAHLQRGQKRHFLQATLFGWSVKAWYWDVEEYQRTKRINPFDSMDPDMLQQVADTYNLPPQLMGENPQLAQRVMARLMEKHSRGRLLPVKYTYRGYEGPKSDFLFIGDCYPEPDFQSLQASNWFIVERRRNRAWIDRVSKAFPELKKGFQDLIDKYPKGTAPTTAGSTDHRIFRERLKDVIDQESNASIHLSEDDRAPEWTILEQHTPGDAPVVSYVGEDSVWIGELDYPYELDGKIAFTECVLIDDLLCGIGDSAARIMRGLHQMHERQINRRFDLIHNILRPLIGTSNMRLLEEPDLIKRHSGFRMVYMRGPGEMWMQGEQGAMSAAAAGMQDESGIMRLYQVLTGESNMSMMANVDPAQNRTATGAKLLAFNQDVLTKDLNDMFAMTSLTSDAEMMYQLNRSELSEPIEFDAGKYNRIFTQEEDAFRQQWARVVPADFQVDGEIVAEAGSTLADDDDSRVTKVNNLFHMLAGNPTVNQEKLRDEVLIANGKGKELQAWAAPPASPPPPPELRTNITVSAKWSELSDQERQEMLQRAGIEVQVVPPAGGLPAAPGLPPGGPQGATGLPPAGQPSSGPPLALPPAGPMPPPPGALSAVMPGGPR